MLLSKLKNTLARFRDDARGSVTVESVLVLSVLFWALAATWEFFEVLRFSSIREKATFTVADMLSRETDSVCPVYMDNTKVLFDEMTHDNGDNQVRASIVKYDADTDTFSISWSKTRGNGDLVELTDADVANAHSTLPILDDGEELIVVDSRSQYMPQFAGGWIDSMPVSKRVFTSIRFLPQINWEETCS